mmetsp:Transcript_64851/g.115367  ORF Transcript_64851/g.115367 Transcript_64851/m.115367 type:complete len:233 (-) Transcript_64851:454-1152(-)
MGSRALGCDAKASTTSPHTLFWWRPSSRPCSTVSASCSLSAASSACCSRSFSCTAWTSASVHAFSCFSSAIAFACESRRHRCRSSSKSFFAAAAAVPSSPGAVGVSRAVLRSPRAARSTRSNRLRLRRSRRQWKEWRRRRSREGAGAGDSLRAVSRRGLRSLGLIPSRRASSSMPIPSTAVSRSWSCNFRAVSRKLERLAIFLCIASCSRCCSRSRASCCCSVSFWLASLLR